MSPIRRAREAGVEELRELDEVLGLLRLIRGTLRDLAHLAPEDLDVGIDEALTTIGHAAQVDRSYLFLFDADERWVDNGHEWCGPGIVPQREQLQGVPVDVIGYWMAPFRRGEVVHVPSVAELPPERAEERATLAAQDIVSLVAVPLLTGRRLVGFLGFDQVTEPRAWSEGSLMLLQAVADAICSALLRREAIDALADRESRYAALVRHSSDVVMIVDDDGTVRYLGSSAAGILGWDSGQRVGSDLLAAVHPRDRSVVASALEHAALQPGVDVRIPDHRLAHVDGTWRWFLATAVDLRDDGTVGGTIVTAHDITSRRRVEEALQHHAMHDAFTGLPNRALLLDRLDQSRKRASRSGTSVGVLFLDVDRFKLINDALGHARGDEMLLEVARRIEGQVRSCDTVARFGGDEFVVLLDEMHDHGEMLAATDRVLAAFDQPFHLAGRTHILTASAGVVLGAPGFDPATLVQDAATAMNQAKEAGRAQVRTFDAPLRDELLRRVELGQDLHGSDERGELELEYQPLYRLTDHRMIGVEALLRWNHPVHGRICPSEFIPLAEEHGLIVRLGRWVLDTALYQLRRWDDGGAPLAGIGLSVNLSVHQLTDAGLTATVHQLLAEHGLPAQRLVLELTESALMAEPEAGRGVLGELRRLGVGVAIDDFGTGYSSLAYLRELPVSILKIDRSFVTGLGCDERDGRVFSAIVGLAQEFDLQVVAEGIETDDQLREAHRLGCHIGQGFLLRSPATASVLEATTPAAVPVAS